MVWLSFLTTTVRCRSKQCAIATPSAGTGLKINLKKTELMKINTTPQTPVIVGGEPIRKVESFIYLGSVVDTQGGTERDIKSRIVKARSAFTMLKNIWASMNFYKNVDTQLQYEVSLSVWSREMVNDHNNCHKDQNILQHLFQAHLQHPMS